MQSDRQKNYRDFTWSYRSVALNATSAHPGGISIALPTFTMSTKTQITALFCAAVVAMTLTFATHLPNSQSTVEQIAPSINQKIVAPLDPSAAQHDPSSSPHLYKPRQVPRKGSLIATPVARAMVA
jgi:hypothetical protein